MPSYGWGSRHSIADWLLAEADGFDFYQAVRLLHDLAPEAVPVAEGSDPSSEPVRFSSNPSLEFPASDLDRVEPAPEGERAPRMVVNFIGLAGALGPLPRPFTELLLERAWRGDRAMRDFLDMFNHRIVSLLYRVRKKSRIGQDARGPGHDHVSGYLYAMLGLGTPGLRGRMRVRDRSLLRYAGLVGIQQRSMSGLEAVLGDYFGVPVAGRPFRGCWYALDPDQLTVVGTLSGRNNALGRGAVVGERVWETSGKFDVVLGPLRLASYLDFLPVGTAYLPLSDLVRFYAGEQLDYDLVLSLLPAEVPESRLGRREGALLGWTSWLKTRPYQGEAPRIRLRAPDLPPELRRLRVRLFADLTTPELADVASRMRGRTYPERAVVFNQGDAGRSLFLITRGSVRVLRTGTDGRELELDTIQEGEFFGEMSVVTGASRSATIVTAEESEILELTEQDLSEVIKRHPRVAEVLAEYAETRVRERTKRLNES